MPGIEMCSPCLTEYNFVKWGNFNDYIKNGYSDSYRQNNFL